MNKPQQCFSLLRREERAGSSQVDRSWWPCLSSGWLEVLRVWETIAIRGSLLRHLGHPAVGPSFETKDGR